MQPSMNQNIQVHDIPMDQLHEDIDFNCRGKIAPLDVADLVKDIDTKGLLQPIIVRAYDHDKENRTGFKFGIVAGFRRFHAFKCLGYSTIPCIIKYGMNDVDARFSNLIENIIRKDINIIQEAKSIEHLKVAGIRQSDIADRLGKSTSWVQIRFKVLNFPADIQKACAEGILNQNQINAIASLPSSKQYEAVRNIKDKRIRNERGTLYIKRPASQNSKRARNKAEINAILEHIYDEVEASFATRCLAWAIGNISSLDLYHDIKEEATKLGKHYNIPEEELL